MQDGLKAVLILMVFMEAIFQLKELQSSLFLLLFEILNPDRSATKRGVLTQLRMTSVLMDKSEFMVVPSPIIRILRLIIMDCKKEGSVFFKVVFCIRLVLCLKLQMVQSMSQLPILLVIRTAI